MAKLIKNNYYTSKGETKINNYQVAISKKTVEASGISDKDEIKVYAKDGRIIIERIKD